MVNSMNCVYTCLGSVKPWMCPVMNKTCYARGLGCGPRLNADDGGPLFLIIPPPSAANHGSPAAPASRQPLLRRAVEAEVC